MRTTRDLKTGQFDEPVMAFVPQPSEHYNKQEPTENVIDIMRYGE